MESPIEKQVIECYDGIFCALFFTPFEDEIDEARKQREVKRTIQEFSDAASQTPIRFFLIQKLSEKEVAVILEELRAICESLCLEDVSFHRALPETVMENLLKKRPLPEKIIKANLREYYRVALHSTMQILTNAGPKFVEWRKLKFARTFEFIRQMIVYLDRINEQMRAMGKGGQEAADDRFDDLYRDYLLSRFHRVEAGTVCMTSNLTIELKELFVMPMVRPASQSRAGIENEATKPMDLVKARELYAPSNSSLETKGRPAPDEVTSALEQVVRYPNNVLIGPPGSGKSTFLEWLQIQLAGAWVEFHLAGQQAIPVLLRVRELDPENLPHGPDIIAKAMASKDRASLMPEQWLHRQMEAGRVFFMLDGLDELDPELVKNNLLPWFQDLRGKYPGCRFLLSSRPTGYPKGALGHLEFVESHIIDFNMEQVGQYVRHWCTAVRMAKNEPLAEAREDGKKDGNEIVGGFQDHPYIRDLAKNPLMLSAVCLVYYFEGGTLPEDRAILYKLCVEGLLHNWDQSRRIHSEFSLEEKLRVCREAALAMQADDRAEYETDKIHNIFTQVLGDQKRAGMLLEHIRRRTGLLLERRPGIFAFVHLTFQEYLAAKAVRDGNSPGITWDHLAETFHNGRWGEVIALYCGLSPAPAAQKMIERLMEQPDKLPLSTVLEEAYLAAKPEMKQDDNLKKEVLNRVMRAPANWGLRDDVMHLEEGIVWKAANRCIGTIRSDSKLSRSFRLLDINPNQINIKALLKKIVKWKDLSPAALSEIIYFLHKYSLEETLFFFQDKLDIYDSTGPQFNKKEFYNSQAEIAILGVCSKFSSHRMQINNGKSICHILKKILEAETVSEMVALTSYESINIEIKEEHSRKEFEGLVRQLLGRQELYKTPKGMK